MQLPQHVRNADADGDGMINRDEFDELLKKAGAKNLSIAEAKKLFEMADKDGDGTALDNAAVTRGCARSVIVDLRYIFA